jgi:hypothetical protein
MGKSWFARTARLAAVVLLVAAVLPSAGCDIFAKGAAGENPLSVDVAYSIKAEPDGRVKPGGGQSLYVERYQDDHSLEQGGATMASGTWKWSVTGPAEATIVSDGGARAHWTAPQTEGTYRIRARVSGKTPMTLGTNIKVTTKKLEIKHSSTGAPIVEEGKEKAPAGTPVKVLDTGNVYGIRKGGKAPSFTLDKPGTVVDITNYHFIDGGGPAPGTISLKSADGKTFGPWPCVGIDGQGAVKNAFWRATPNAALPAGTYTVVDSDPGTWSTNDAAKGIGFSTVMVVY